MRDRVTAYIGLGANLGQASRAVQNAMQDIADLADVQLMQHSALYCSAPVDSTGPDYVNAVVEVQTQLSAPELLAQLQNLEAEAGRARPYRNAPRTLDLDLLLYGHASIASAALTVPHPRMWERAFVLLPLAQIAPQWVSVAQLDRVADQRIRQL